MCSDSSDAENNCDLGLPQEMVALLLDNYTEYMTMTVYDRDKQAVQAAPFLSESEIVLLFSRFPSRAAAFLMDVPMRSSPGLVKRTSYCDFRSHDNCIIRSGNNSHEDDVKGQFWEKELDSIWCKSPDTDKAERRADDVAWGEPVMAAVLPIVGSRTKVMIETATQRVERELREKQQQDFSENQQRRRQFSSLGQQTSTDSQVRVSISSDALLQR
eukprot:COSAG01_NODE_572_length_15298_cov_8.549172_20_plen_215_part_00